MNHNMTCQLFGDLIFTSYVDFDLSDFQFSSVVFVFFKYSLTTVRALAKYSPKTRMILKYQRVLGTKKHTSYLSFFLPEQNFWRITFTPKKRINYDKIHSKLPFFLRYYGKIYSKLPIFRVKSVKIYTGPKKFTRTCSWGS